MSQYVEEVGLCAEFANRMYGLLTADPQGNWRLTLAHGAAELLEAFSIMSERRAEKQALADTSPVVPDNLNLGDGNVR